MFEWLTWYWYLFYNYITATKKQLFSDMYLVAFRLYTNCKMLLNQSNYLYCFDYFSVVYEIWRTQPPSQLTLNTPVVPSVLWETIYLSEGRLEILVTLFFLGASNFVALYWLVPGTDLSIISKIGSITIKLY